MPKMTNPTGERIALPNGFVIDGETEVPVEIIRHADNRAYVEMLLRKGRLIHVVKKTKPKPKPEPEAE